MTSATSLSAAPIGELPPVGPAALCMGVFDGVHRGHLALLRATVEAASRRGARSVALVFDPHPDEVVRPGTVVPRLAPLAENLRLLAEAGIDAPLPVRFDAALRALTPEEFLAAMAHSIELRALVMTPESAFGRNRAGTPDSMSEYGRAVGFEVVLVDEVVRDAGAPISSGRIREAVARGDIPSATDLLAHAPYLEAGIGERTSSGWNLAFDYTPARPAPGRYPVSIRGAGEAELYVQDDAVVIETSGANPDGQILRLDLLPPTSS